MKKRRESDASLWIGLVLGGVLGAAATVILAASSEPDTNFPRLNLRPQADSNAARLGISTSPGDVATVSVSTTPTTVSVKTNTTPKTGAQVEQAGKSLKENDEERMEGAAEAAG